MTKNERNLVKVLKAEESNARKLAEYYLEDDRIDNANYYNNQAMTLSHVILMIENKSLKEYAKIYNVELE